MGRIRILLVSLILAVHGPASFAGAAGEEEPVRDCGSREQWVEAMSRFAGSASRLVESGDPEAAYRICRTGAQTLIRDHPDCPEIRRRLEDSLGRAETLSRSSDRAREMIRSFDDIRQEFDAEVQGDAGTADGETIAGPSDTAGNDTFYWFTDPYFLMLELILLLVLVLIREARRLRPNLAPPGSKSQPFRYRVIPEQGVAYRRSERKGSGRTTR